jgi:hypothetical protein
MSRNRRPVAGAEPAARRMLGEQGFDRLQAGAEPMLDPGEPLLFADLQHVGEVVPHPRHDQRVLLLGAAMTASPPLRAQQKAMPVIGYLNSRSPGESAPALAAFHRERFSPKWDEP